MQYISYQPVEAWVDEGIQRIYAVTTDSLNHRVGQVYLVNTGIGQPTPKERKTRTVKKNNLE